jgi:hypothetical protein
MKLRVLSQVRNIASRGVSTNPLEFGKGLSKINVLRDAAESTHGIEIQVKKKLEALEPSLTNPYSKTLNSQDFSFTWMFARSSG